MDPEAIDWNALVAAARDVAARAYAPYSHYLVGAAGLVDDGRTVVGCNVENASFGLTLCAECALVAALHTGGGGRFVAVVCVTGDGTVVTPCGRCRQLLAEHSTDTLLVATTTTPVALSTLLPDPFGPDDLTGR
ncbi:MAG: cytidine deaminase [Micrococcales bacterium]|nr:cytidine deaminase [Micrococcales bacterium]